MTKHLTPYYFYVYYLGQLFEVDEGRQQPWRLAHCHALSEVHWQKVHQGCDA